MIYIKDETKGDRVYMCDREFECPGCQAPLDGCKVMTNDYRDRAPEEGDITVCGHCGEIMVFDANADPKQPDLNDMLMIQQYKEWPEIQEVSQRLKDNPLPT